MGVTLGSRVGSVVEAIVGCQVGAVVGLARDATKYTAPLIGLLSPSLMCAPINRLRVPLIPTSLVTETEEPRKSFTLPIMENQREAGSTTPRSRLLSSEVLTLP